MLCGAQEFVLQFVGTVQTASQSNFLCIQPMDIPQDCQAIDQQTQRPFGTGTD